MISLNMERKCDVMKRLMSVNGVDFELKKPSNYIPDLKGYSLTDVYVTPSEYKKRIWKGWLEWAVNADVGMWICSYNYQHFCIGGKFKFAGATWCIKITPTHNFIWQLIPECEVII